MDVSNSMSADDLAPSRLAACAGSTSSFIDAQPDSVEIGVVWFDQGALATSRPSVDRAAAKARCRGCGLPVGPHWRRRFSVR